MEFVPAGRVMVSLCVPGLFTGVILSKPQKFHRVPRGEEARPGTALDQGHSARARRSLQGPSFAGCQPCGLCSSFPITLGWRQQAGPASRLCVGPVRGRAANDLFFWARGAIWVGRPQLWSQNNKNKSSKDSWAAWTREPTAPARSC